MKRKKAESDQEGFVYFLQGTSSGWVKIGFTTDLKRRLRTQQGGSPEKLKYIGYMKGTKTDEKKLHKYFEHVRRRGEWFDANFFLMSFVCEKCNRDDLEKYNK